MIKENRYAVSGGLAIILAAFFWSLDGLFIRTHFYAYPAGLIVFWEHFLGLIALCPFIIMNWWRIRSLKPRHWLAIFWVSLFGGLLGTLFITKAFFAAFAGETTFATVVILQKLQPFFALFLARAILKEKLPSRFYLWAALAIAASYFLAFGGTGLNLSQVDWLHSAAVFAFLAAFAFGSSTVFGKRLANHLDYRAVAGLRFLLTSILAFILILIGGNLAQTAAFGAKQWALLALIVLTSGAGAMFIYYYGLRRVSASTATILELFWPVSALVMDYFFNGARLSWIQALAALVIIFAFFKVSSLGRAEKLFFKAKVVFGRQRGRRLGFPTANLDRLDLDIPHGIYVIKAEVEGKPYSGLMHFGYKDAFGEPPSLEVLLKDFSGDLYGREIGIKVGRKLREIKGFKGEDRLKEAIRRDLEAI